MHKASLKRSF